MTEFEQQCPVALRDYNPFEPGHLADPYPLWMEAQEHSPFFASNAGFWVVTRYADVLEVAKDAETFTSRESLNFRPVPESLRSRLPHGYPQAYPSLINTDPPEHARLRRPPGRAITPRSAEALAPAIEETANRLIDAFVSDGRADIVSQFATPLPVSVIATFLGVPVEDHDDFQRWSNDAFLMSNPTLDDATLLHCATSMAELGEYLDEQIRRRRAEPGDDLLSQLLGDFGEAAELADPEVKSITAQLLIGGNVTTTDLLGNTLMVLLADAGRYQHALDDLERVPRIIEEVLRYKSSIRGLFRTTTRDVELGGAMIPEGATVWVVFGAANYDKSVFPDPATFDPDRENLNQHVAFGRGTHTCIGAPLARVEARIATRLLLERLPNMRIEEGQSLTYPASPISAGVDQLFVKWDS